MIIYRQDAIDAADRADYTGLAVEDVKKVTDEVVKELKKLPPAQPEPSTEIQKILDYLDNTLHPIVSPNNWNVYSELHDMVSKLTSIQPEIIHCRDCKHRGEKPIAGGRYWCEIHDTFMYYCSDAERRTDE